MTAHRPPKPRQLRQQLQALAEDWPRWNRADQLIEAGDWAAAINHLNALAADVARTHRALGAMAAGINGRHWSPLLALAPSETTGEAETITNLGDG